jgi:AcrR family transcriptional regulator
MVTQSGGPMDRKERRHQETRDEILREARRLVAQHGANEMSMRELAKNTGFTPPGLYRYFPAGKDDILKALAVSSIAMLADHLRRVPVDLPIEERLLRLCLTYLEYAREHRQELDIMLESISAVDSDALERESFHGKTGVFGIVGEALNAAAEAGILKASTPDELALIFHGAWSLLHGMAVLETVHPHHDDLFRVHAPSILRAFLNGFSSDWAATAPVGTPCPCNPLKERP